MSSLRSFIRDEEGAALVEYGLLIALIAALCIISIKSIGQKISTAFASVDTNLP